MPDSFCTFVPNIHMTNHFGASTFLLKPQPTLQYYNKTNELHAQVKLTPSICFKHSGRHVWVRCIDIFRETQSLNRLKFWGDPWPISCSWCEFPAAGQHLHVTAALPSPPQELGKIHVCVLGPLRPLHTCKVLLHACQQPAQPSRQTKAKEQAHMLLRLICFER